MAEEKCKCNKGSNFQRYFIGGVAGVLLSALVINLPATTNVYKEDVNKDGIEDIVTVAASGHKKVFYGVQVGDKIEYRLPKDIEGWDYNQNPPFQ